MGPICIILNGPPGSGKGTLIKGMKRLGFEADTLPMSGELRMLEHTNPRAYTVAQKAMDNGDLVPDEIVIAAFHRAWDKMKDHAIKNIILDGVVRTTAQAEKTALAIREAGCTAIILNLNVPKDCCWDRICGRKELEGRADDANEKIVMNRFRHYEESTVIAIDYLAPMLEASYDIDGTLSPEEVVKEALEYIKEHLQVKV